MCEPKPNGRPTAYKKKEHDELVFKLCLLGSTDAQMADILGICEKTFNTWKHKHKSFLQSLKRGKEEADAVIAQSLYHRAKGYTHKEVKLAQVDGRFTDSKEIDKHYPPDPTSCIFWLKNRQSGKWREKQEVENSGDIKITIDQDDAKL